MSLCQNSNYENFHFLLIKSYLVMDEQENEKLATLPTQLLITTICHPMEYAKVLIQIGYEPISPRPSTTLFGRPTLLLPNVFQYIKHINGQDGFLGCYTGLSPRLIGIAASSLWSTTLIETIGISPDLQDPPNIATDEEPKVQDYVRYTKRDLVMQVATVVISYPFQVISVRMMASFVGNEGHYKTLPSAVVSIFRENGLLGFYNGFIPKLMGDIICIATTGVLAYFVNKYLVKTKDLRCYTFPLLTFITTTLTYPMIVVSTCMAVVGSSLRAGQPPLMPAYSGWAQCWRDLVANKQHKRGSSLIFRYYIAPVYRKDI